MNPQVAAYVEANLPPLPAGPYASKIAVLSEVNNVGGANIGMNLSAAVLAEVLQVTTTRFTGSSRQLSCGELIQHQINGTGLHFGPGSIQIIGAPSASAVRIFIHELVRRFRSFGYHPTICWMSIDNKVVNGKVGHCVALERVEDQLPGFETDYNPKKFPGVICTYQDAIDGDLTFMLFECGNVVALGINDMNRANRIYLRFVAMMPAFKTDIVRKTQTNKSQERVARRATEQQQRGDDDGDEYDVAFRISMRVKDYLDERPALINDTSHARSLKSEIERIVAEEKAAPSSSRKRLFADDDDEEEEKDLSHRDKQHALSFFDE